MSLSEPVTTAGDILIVDDTPDNLRFLSDLLTKAEYTVRKVTNGEMGLEAARLEPPDLILLDIQMPGLSGYEVCARLKISERTQHIPVIFLSARDEELDKVIAFEAGGVDYITKPFQVVEVLARIKTHLSLSRLQQQLKRKNDQLSQEMSQRTAVELAFQQLNQEPSNPIEDQTLELQENNVRLNARYLEVSQAGSQPQHLAGLKSQQIKAMAREFQTSLAAIANTIDTLNQQKVNSDIKTHLAHISDQVNHMSQVLQDSLPIINSAQSVSSETVEPESL